MGTATLLPSLCPIKDTSLWGDQPPGLPGTEEFPGMWDFQCPNWKNPWQMGISWSLYLTGQGTAKAAQVLDPQMGWFVFSAGTKPYSSQYGDWWAAQRTGWAEYLCLNSGHFYPGHQGSENTSQKVAWETGNQSTGLDKRCWLGKAEHIGWQLEAPWEWTRWSRRPASRMEASGGCHLSQWVEVNESTKQSEGVRTAVQGALPVGPHGPVYPTVLCVWPYLGSYPEPVTSLKSITTVVLRVLEQNFGLFA